MRSPDTRPNENEYASSFAGYVALVPEQEILSVLAHQTDALRKVVAGIPVEKELFRYAPGKWSVREVFGHMGDAERVFGYRAFSIARGEQAPLPGFDENAYVSCAEFDRHTLALLAGELFALRESNLMLFRSLDEWAWLRTGIANRNPISVRALAYISAGHIRHHLKILKERYGLEM